MNTRTALFVALLLFVPGAGFAAHGPDWWYERGVIRPSEVDDYAAFNQGQLKHIATAARDELEERLDPSGAKWVDLDNLVSSWASPSNADDFSLVNLGQLKYVANYFYEFLDEEGIVTETPWDASPNPTDHYALANIGQLKNVFSFDLDDGCWFSEVFAEDSNMLVYSYSFIGDREQRGCFHDGGDAGIALVDGQNGEVIRGMDEGYLFSTGEAEYWNERAHEQDAGMGREQDADLQHWMETFGFDAEHVILDRDQPGFPEYETDDAAGISFDFEVNFDNPSIETGTLEVPFIFGSDEYFNVPESQEIKNDSMAIFVFELDDENNPLPYTRTNIGLLPDTDTHSRAVNVFNAGETFWQPDAIGEFDEKTDANQEHAEFRKNSPHDAHYDNPDNPPPYKFGYTGFTGRLDEGYEGRLIASGGVVDGVEVTTVMMQSAEVGPEVTDAGWGGVIVQGKVIRDGQFRLLCGYVVAFGLEDGKEVFTLYRLDGHNLNDPVLPNTTEATIEVMKSIEVSNFKYNEWYTVNVKITGDSITASYWEGTDTNEEADGEIEENDGDPLARGFVGAIHLQQEVGVTAPSHLIWDWFEAESLTDFEGEIPGSNYFPYAWTMYGLRMPEWEVIEDGDASGDRMLGYENSSGLTGAGDPAHVNALVWHGRGKTDTGSLEAGKRYRVKIVVADGDDTQWDSILMLEKESIRIIPNN